jgi:putative RNA 2'-phosphotransferase
MNRKDTIRLGKFLSYLLRHRPDHLGLELDEGGWASVSELLEACRTGGKTITSGQLAEVVATDDKQRFEFSPDGSRVRASQGHSLPVDLGYEPREPPENLYHGTARRSLASIRKRGIVRGKRHHVHLSPDEPTALKVGSRHGKPVVLRIRAREMFEAGYAFLLSSNGIWLADEVPAAFIDFPEEE